MIATSIGVQIATVLMIAAGFILWLVTRHKL